MAYYSERHGMRNQREKTYNISIEAYNLILEIIDRYKINLGWKFPERCQDNDENICGIDEEKLNRDLRFEIPELFNEDGFIRPRRKYNVFDGEESEEFNQFALLDYIEYIAMNVRDYIVDSRHPFFSHNHYRFVKGDRTYNDFLNEIDQAFEKIGLLYKINDDGQVERIVANELMIKTVEQQIIAVKEQGLKDLLGEAISLYKDPNTARIKDATEKLWDAFERLKTYYTTLKKPVSADKVVTDAASGNTSMKSLLDEEFVALTKIGNNYRIRHHETDKIEITDINHYEYFFNRCLSAVSLAIKYLE